MEEGAGEVWEEVGEGLEVAPAEDPTEEGCSTAEVEVAEVLMTKASAAGVVVETFGRTSGVGTETSLRRLVRTVLLALDGMRTEEDFLVRLEGGTSPWLLPLASGIVMLDQVFL